MLLHWHLQEEHQPCSVVPSEVDLRKTVELDKVLSSLALDGDGIHNIAVSEDLIWSPVAFLGVLNTSCSRHKFVLSYAEVATFNS